VPRRGGERAGAPGRISGVAALLLAAVVIASGCGSDSTARDRARSTATSTSTIATPVPTSTRRDDFSSGGFAEGAWSSEGATVVAADGTAPGAYAQLRAEDGPAYLLWDQRAIRQGRRYWSFRGWFRVESRAPGQSVGLATVKNGAGEHHADLFVDAPTGGCRIDLYSEDSVVTPFRCDDGAWHSVEMRGDYGSSTYTMDWTVDGAALPSIASTNQPPTTARSLWLGDSTPGKTNVSDWSDVAVTVANTPLGFLGPP
jgi:hypothetical protein